jgi:putative Ca2+/H+ antiporter (TMEM165/GDT1 family)
VVLGSFIFHWLPEALLKKIAGMGFILIGGLILWGEMMTA